MRVVPKMAPKERGRVLAAKKRNYLGVVLLKIMLVGLGVADALGYEHHAALWPGTPIDPARPTFSQIQNWSKS